MGGGGSGGSTNIQQLAPGDIRKFYQFQQNQFHGYFNNEPLLSGARTDALNYDKQLPGMLNQIGGYNTQLGQYSDRFNQTASDLQGIVNSGGKATNQELRNVDQGSLTGMSDTRSTGALGTELLNRDQFTQQRYNTALGQLQGVTGMQSGITAEQAGLVGQQQGMQTSGLNQLTGVQGAATGTFTQLQNPILQVPLANLQARIAQAQVNQTANTAGASKAGGAAGGIGSIVGAVLPIVASAFSDERLKEGIKKTGLKTADGIPLKTFRYRGDKRRYLGALAQDIEKVHPEAVREDLLSGFKFVDLAKAGVPMAQLA